MMRCARVAMALSALSGDEQGIILGQLRSTLEPRLVMYFSSASKELRALLTPAARQQLRTDYEEATALCLKVGMRGCKELREATKVDWFQKDPSEADLATLAKLGSVLPALKELILSLAGPDGVQRLAEGLVAGALPAVTWLEFDQTQVGDAGASALAAALDRGALPRLESLTLMGDCHHTDIGDAGLAALAPALRRRPALKDLRLKNNPFGDEGLAALVAPPPPAAGTPPPPAGGLKKLEFLDLEGTEVTDAGCAVLAAALDSGALPALKELEFGWFRDDLLWPRHFPTGIPASGEAIDAVDEALARSMCRWEVHRGDAGCD